MCDCAYSWYSNLLRCLLRWNACTSHITRDRTNTAKCMHQIQNYYRILGENRRWMGRNLENSRHRDPIKSISLHSSLHSTKYNFNLQQIHVFVMHLMFSIKWDLSCEQLISQHHSEYETNHLQKILCYIAYIVDFVVVRAVDWIRMTPLSSELLISMERMLNWECSAKQNCYFGAFCFWLFEVARDERYFAFIFIHAKASNHCVCAPKPKSKHLAVAENVKIESKIPRCHSKLI